MLILYYFFLIFSFLIYPVINSLANESKHNIFLKNMDLLTAEPSYKNVGKLTFVKGFELLSNDPRFGGFSGLIINKKNLISVSDRGYWLKAQLMFNQQGIIEKIVDTSMGNLKDENNNFLIKENSDAEAIEKFNEEFVISFERNHRVLKYKDLDETPQILIPNKLLNNLPYNGGIEAMTPLDNHTIFTLTEDMVFSNGNLLITIFNPNKNISMEFKKYGTYKPTDLSLLPNGNLLLLERSYSRAKGASARISIIEKTDFSKFGVLKSNELGKISPPMTVDNFEGISYIELEDGGFFIFLLSDDNYNYTQKTLLFQFYWDGKY